MRYETCDRMRLQPPEYRSECRCCLRSRRSLISEPDFTADQDH
ncbi:hypothetical protein SLEP1_g56702 [Rubroshorea leprosula]|uniref:Uncharacterized protein n=1 Tax=Rubroshorea leprosula TaxID=152421 RepID=A0AAV5MKF7_9ROSI|nr:hypothetical protein SLEP1_g56702 [Rubroshorea leprosula]